MLRAGERLEVSELRRLRQSEAAPITPSPLEGFAVVAEAIDNCYNYTIITLSNTTIAENQSAGTEVGIFTTSDPDGPGKNRSDCVL
jgi:hypothetical protein